VSGVAAQGMICRASSSLSSSLREEEEVVVVVEPVRRQGLRGCTKGGGGRERETDVGQSGARSRRAVGRFSRC
jgi:hypothetical protein